MKKRDYSPGDAGRGFSPTGQVITSAQMFGNTGRPALERIWLNHSKQWAFYLLRGNSCAFKPWEIDFPRRTGAKVVGKEAGFLQTRARSSSEGWGYEMAFKVDFTTPGGGKCRGPAIHGYPDQQRFFDRFCKPDRTEQ
jgi:hypothetical protein